MVVNGGSKPVNRLTHTRRSLRVNYRDKLGLYTVNLRDDILLIENLTPGRVDPFDDSAAPLGDVHHAISEHSIHANERFVARFDQVDEYCLHAGGSRSADRKSHFVLSAECLPHLNPNAAHNVEKHRVEMANGRLGKSL